MKKEAFVVSDLHLGAGAIEPRLEDFDQDDHLAGFVDRIARPGVTIFINGDFLDLPQIPPYDLGPADHLLWDEASSIRKVESAIESHCHPFDALGRFVNKGGELWLHAGNHDLDLAWPGVQSRLRAEIGQAVKFSMTHSVYYGVHIEHGHMFTPENAPKNAASFLHTHRFPDGTEKAYVERVWGTDFMLGFYNDLERSHPFADNVKPILTALYYGIKNRWVGARDILRLVLYLKRAGVPWAGVGSAVLTAPPGEDKLPKAIDDAIWQRAIGERLAKDPKFREELRAEIAMLPQAQQALLDDGHRVQIGVGDAQTAPDGKTLGVFREERQHRAAAERLAAPGVTHVIFGHTHEEINGDMDGRLFNTGTWLPHLDFNRADVKAKIRAHGLTLDMLDDATLYDRRRMVARITPDPVGNSRVELVLADNVV